MRRPYAHISVPLAVLQVVAVVLGVFMMRLAFMGFEDSVLNQARYRLPLLVRNHGYFLLTVPLLWTGLVLWLENRPGAGWWSRRWTVASGLLLLAALACFLFQIWIRTYFSGLMM
jgi:hypothetical protein